ncbi:MAG: sigma-70 family RNA polymerase sigma factor [Rhizomicrobium sp.]
MIESIGPAQLNALVVAVAQARDKAAFQALFDHFAPRVKGYLMRLGAGNAVAEDLAQEAMLAVWRKAALFDPAKASASTWIFTIARNLRIDAIRKERRPRARSQRPRRSCPMRNARPTRRWIGPRRRIACAPRSPVCRASKRGSSNCLSSRRSRTVSSRPNWACRSAR